MLGEGWMVTVYAWKIWKKEDIVFMDFSDIEQIKKLACVIPTTFLWMLIVRREDVE